MADVLPSQLVVGEAGKAAIIAKAATAAAEVLTPIGDILMIISLS